MEIQGGFPFSQPQGRCKTNYDKAIAMLPRTTEPSCVTRTSTNTVTFLVIVPPMTARRRSTDISRGGGRTRTGLRGTGTRGTRGPFHIYYTRTRIDHRRSKI
eukprot:scaffold12941_cov19-Prasinocladus_malaysianus.AAC.1